MASQGPAAAMLLLEQSAAEDFVLHYQPIYSLDSGAVVAWEALIRKRTKSGRLIGPMGFIPAMERSDAILDVGRWVVQRACRDLTWLRSVSHQRAQVCVNVAARQLESHDFVDDVLSALDRHRLHPEALEFEITERMPFEARSQSLHTISTLASAGCTISLDDFGTGFSNFTLLTDLPVDRLKLPRELVASSILTTAIIRGIANIARDLGIEVIAEGIESEEQEQRVQDVGVRLGQGFLRGIPAGLEEIAARYGAGSPTSERPGEPLLANAIAGSR